MRDDLVEEHTANRRRDELAIPPEGFGDPHPDPGLQLHLTLVVGDSDLVEARESAVVAPRAELVAGHEVQPENDVLRRDDDRLPMSRRQDVVGRHHERPRLDLRLDREGHVHGHLVAVEVGVVRRAHERMELDRLALDEDRFERLDAEAVKRRGAVQ